jgi:hypothetical protein
MDIGLNIGASAIAYIGLTIALVCGFRTWMKIKGQ